MISRRLQFLFLFLCVIVAIPVLAVTQYEVTIDTSAVEGTAGALAFDFTSNGYGNSATIFSYTTDGVTGLPETQGGLVSGDLILLLNPAPFTTIEGGSFFNELVLPFTSFGKSITFTVELTEQPPTCLKCPCGGIPDEFALFLLNSARQPLFPTSDALGANALFAICITGQPAGLLGVFAPTTFVAPSQLNILVPVPAPFPAQFANISTRLSVGTDDNVLIGGYIVTGTEGKMVIVRAIGPSLPLAGALADPVLELHDPSGATISINDNWQDSANKQAIIDTGLSPTNDNESAILMTLDPGPYTAIVHGANGTTGIALVEVYDLDQTVVSKLANISTRGFVQTGDDVMIGGLIVLGTIPANTIIRAIGPSLPLTGALADPTLELYDKDGVIIASNDDWRSDQEADIIATNLQPSNDTESAIVATLTPDAYTAIVRGKDNTTGIALVEAYQLDN